MKDKSTAALFAFFLGGVGAHHYYLGRTARGVVYTLFCWTLIPGLIGFIEGIMLATMDTNAFHLKYNAAYIDHSQEDSVRLDNLKKLHDLKASGALSEEEFHEARKKIVA